MINLSVQEISQTSHLILMVRQSLSQLPPFPPPFLSSSVERPKSARLANWVVASVRALVIASRSGPRRAPYSACWSKVGFSGAARVVLSAILSVS